MEEKSGEKVAREVRLIVIEDASRHDTCDTGELILDYLEGNFDIRSIEVVDRAEMYQAAWNQEKKQIRYTLNPREE